MLTRLTWSRSLDEFADGLCSSIEAIRPGVVVAMYAMGAHGRLLPLGRPRLPAEPHACWTAPLVNTDGATAGVLAFHYPEAIEPPATDLTIVDLCADLCLVALERGRLSAELTDAIHVDPVTGLPTPACFDDEVARDSSFPAGAVIAIGVDNLTELHRALGQDAGDVVLAELTSRFRHELRKVPGARTYRTQDGSFLSTLPNIGEELASIIAGRILAIADQPVTVGELPVRVTLSVGVGVAPSHGRDLHSVRRAAELALSKAEERSDSRVEYFDEYLSTATSERFSLSASLDAAIRAERLTVAFQPQINLLDDTLAGVECLARWPGAPHIPTPRFIDIAERTGLIGELDRLILETACRQLRTWRDQGLRIPRLSVNVSTHTLTDPAFVDFADRVVSTCGLDPAEVTIELTESLLIDDADAWSTAAELHDLGFQLSIDDFGTGYSSLSRLSKLPFAELKLDQSLLMSRDADPRMDAVIAAAIRLGLALGLDVVAEGVEHESDIEFLKGQGAIIAQGFIIAPPLSASELPRFLRETGRG